jgi:hypothetical protein
LIRPLASREPPSWEGRGTFHAWSCTGLDGSGESRADQKRELGGPVEVGSADLMHALMHSGQDYRRYAFGGTDADKVFLLDQHDRLTELPA